MRQDLEALRAIGYEVGYNQQTGKYEWSKAPGKKLHGRRKAKGLAPRRHVYYYLHLTQEELEGLMRLRDLYASDSKDMEQRSHDVPEIRAFLERIIIELPPNDGVQFTTDPQSRRKISSA